MTIAAYRTSRSAGTAPAQTPRISYLIGRLDRALRRQLGDALSPSDLTVQQYTALSVLHSRGSLSNAQLARRSFMTPQAANEVVKLMERRRWIERTPDPSHRRILRIRLTAAGKAALRTGDAAADALEQLMLDGLSTPKRSELRQQLLNCVRALGAGLGVP